MEKISAFLQCPLVGEELTSSLRHCSFSSMRDNTMVNYTLVPQEIMDHSKGKFMRKGEAPLLNRSTILTRVVCQSVSEG